MFQKIKETLTALT